ncbi:MAG: hypothetical protein LAT57_10075 [Balneolales bacterium]|nr:hypothetical protein [Balneolales bacterium]
MKKALILILLTILIIFSGLLLWLRYGVNEVQIQSMLSDALGPEFVVEINSARVSPLKRAVSIGKMSISATSDSQTVFQSDTIRITGINPGIYFSENINFSKVRLDNFTIDWDDSLLAESGGLEGDEPTENINARKIAIRSLDLTNGTVVARKDGTETNRISGFNLNSELSVEFMSVPDSMKLIINVDSLGFLFSEDRYRLSLSELNFNQQDSLLTLSSMKLTPIGGFSQFMSTLEFKQDMVEMSLTNFKATGIDPSAHQNKEIIKARTLDFDAFDIHISADLHLPLDPNRERPTLLNETIQKLPFAVQLDSIYLRNTNVQYSERNENGVRPGTISFMNSTIQLYDVNSLSSSPAKLNAVTYLQNHSELSTFLSFTLDDAPFRMTGTGNLQRFDLKQLNSIMMDVMGVEVMSGVAHELEFDFKMMADTSSGRMHLIYDDLKVEIIDKDDHEEGFMKSIVSLIANEGVLRSNNLPNSEDEVRTGEIDHVRPPESPFFQHLWQTLRSGLYDIVLRL